MWHLASTSSTQMEMVSGEADGDDQLGQWPDEEATTATEDRRWQQHFNINTLTLK
jgi:hypothetical protein